MVTLYTPRLILRPPELADAERVTELANNYEVARTLLALPHPYQVEHAIGFIRSTMEGWAETRDYVFAMVLREVGQVIGMIGLHPHGSAHNAEIGYWVGQPYWGKGYTTEAAGALLDYAFGELGLNRVYSRHFAGNEASGRVMQKIGMIYEGTQRQHIHRFDQVHDVLLYGILRDEWLARKREQPP